MHQNWGNRAFFPRAHASLSKAEVLDAFLSQFYDDKPVPRLVLLSEDVENAALLAEAFSARAARKVEILRPQRGRRRTSSTTRCATRSRSCRAAWPTPRRRRS